MKPYIIESPDANGLKSIVNRTPYKFLGVIQKGISNKWSVRYHTLEGVQNRDGFKSQTEAAQFVYENSV